MISRSSKTSELTKSLAVIFGESQVKGIFTSLKRTDITGIPNGEKLSLKWVRVATLSHTELVKETFSAQTK